MAKILEFLIVYGVVAIGYYLFFGIKNKRNNKKGKKKKKNKEEMSIEMMYLLYVYNIDVKKVDDKRFNLACTFINAFIIAVVYMVVVYLVKQLIFQIVIGIVLLVLLIIICYGVLANSYIKKGMVEKCTITKK